MKTEYIEPFIKATNEVFETMLGMLPKIVGQSSITEEDKSNDNVSAILGLSGDVKFSINLNFSREMALKVVSEFLGEPKEAIDDEVIDAIGEIVNMIGGNADAKLTMFKLDLSLPTVIIGQNYTIRRPEGISCVTIFFETKYGPFNIEIVSKEL